MDPRPRLVTAESLGKQAGSNNVWTVSFAGSEIRCFTKETSWRESPSGERADTVIHCDAPVQREHLARPLFCSACLRVAPTSLHGGVMWLCARCYQTADILAQGLRDGLLVAEAANAQQADRRPHPKGQLLQFGHGRKSAPMRFAKEPNSLAPQGACGERS